MALVAFQAQFEIRGVNIVELVQKHKSAYIKSWSRVVAEISSIQTVALASMQRVAPAQSSRASAGDPDSKLEIHSFDLCNEEITGNSVLN